MDEILGETPFATPGESTSITEVLESGEWESGDPFRHEAAEARLDEWESELGEQPWSGEQERGWTRSGRHGGRGRAPAYPGPALAPAATPSVGSPTTTAPAQNPGPVSGLATDATSCPDVTYLGEPWNRGKPGRHQTAEGSVTQQKVAESAAVRVLELGDYDVDDYRLRPAHRAVLGVHVAALASALRAGRIVAPITISVQGRTSSSGSMSHNLALSRHRAVNVVNMVHCLARQAGIEPALQVRWTPLGESVSQTTTGDNVEGPEQRQVRIQVIAPRPAGFQQRVQQPVTSAPGAMPVRVPNGSATYRPGYPVRRPGFRAAPRRPGSRVAHLCFEVVSIRRSPGFTWLRLNGQGTVSAQIRVHDHRNRSAALYVLQGVVLPTTGQGSSGLLGRLGPLARLAAMARRILAIAARARIPTRGCTPTSATAQAGDPARQLGGTAVLVIPPAGSGRAAMHLRPRSPRVRISRRLVPVRAKRYPMPLVIVGRLRLAAQGVRWGGAKLGVRELGESEFAELNEYGELELNELNELGELGEYGEWEGELNEFGEAEGEGGEVGESESEFEGVGEFGELGESEAEFGELGEYGESTNEWTEFGELEFGELEGSGELTEYGETTNELGEFGEFESEYGEAEFGEFEGPGELNEYGEFGG